MQISPNLNKTRVSKITIIDKISPIQIKKMELMKKKGISMIE